MQRDLKAVVGYKKLSNFVVKIKPMKKIQSIKELKEVAGASGEGFTDFFIVLGGGIAKSSKRISYDPSGNTFTIINEIDDSVQEDISEDELKVETMIVEAIEKGAFYQY